MLLSPALLVLALSTAPAQAAPGAGVERLVPTRTARVEVDALDEVPGSAATVDTLLLMTPPVEDVAPAATSSVVVLYVESVSSSAGCATAIGAPGSDDGAALTLGPLLCTALGPWWRWSYFPPDDPLERWALQRWEAAPRRRWRHVPPVSSLPLFWLHERPPLTWPAAGSFTWSLG